MKPLFPFPLATAKLKGDVLIFFDHFTPSIRFVYSNGIGGNNRFVPIGKADQICRITIETWGFFSGFTWTPLIQKVNLMRQYIGVVIAERNILSPHICVDIAYEFSCSKRKENRFFTPKKHHQNSNNARSPQSPLLLLLKIASFPTHLIFRYFLVPLSKPFCTCIISIRIYKSVIECQNLRMHLYRFFNIKPQSCFRAPPLTWKTVL